MMDLAAALSTGLGVFSNTNAVNVAVVLKVGDGRGDRTDSYSGCGSRTGKVSSNLLVGSLVVQYPEFRCLLLARMLLAWS